MTEGFRLSDWNVGDASMLWTDDIWAPLWLLSKDRKNSNFPLFVQINTIVCSENCSWHWKKKKQCHTADSHLRIFQLILITKGRGWSCGANSSDLCNHLTSDFWISLSLSFWRFWGKQKYKTLSNYLSMCFMEKCAYVFAYGQ